MTRAIKSIVPYFGGKRTMAPTIVQQLGKHRAYWEPFCGSMAVLLAKPACSMEAVNDLHGDLTNLGRVIQHDTLGPALYRRLRRILVDEAALKDACDQLDSTGMPGDEPDVSRAIAYFVQSWMMRSGTAGTNIGQTRGVGRSIAVRYTPNGGALNPRWINAVDSIPQWRARMRGVLILRRNAFDIIPKIDDEDGTAIYVDSPYLKATRTGMKGSGGVSRYLHEFDHDTNDLFGDDHKRLASELARFKKARVVVSYYDDPRLEVLYPGWTKVPVAGNKAMVNQSRRGKSGATPATEVLLINGPSYETAA